VQGRKGKVRLVKMNIDDHHADPRPARHPVDPAVIAFKNGSLSTGFMGALPESQVPAFSSSAWRGRAAPACR
jgi:putative thioredoxin